MENRRIPIFNRGPDMIEIGLEPEGDCLQLEPGDAIEIRYSLDAEGDPTLELEIEGRLISIHCMAIKEVWRGEKRIK